MNRTKPAAGGLDIVVINASIVVVQTGFGRALAPVDRMWEAALMNFAFAATLILVMVLLGSHGAMGIAYARLLRKSTLWAWHGSSNGTWLPTQLPVRIDNHDRTTKR